MSLKRRRVLIVRPLGTGKTAIALRIIAEVVNKSDKPALVVGPAHLLPQYETESVVWQLPFNFRLLAAPIPEYFLSKHCYAVSYAFLRMYRDLFSKQKWSVIIADEIHRAKNSCTLNHHTLTRLRECSERFVGMTGAPFQNSPYEFFTLVSLIAGKSLNRKLEACLDYRCTMNYSWFRRILIRLLNVRMNQGPIIGVKHPQKLHLLVSPVVDFRPDISYSEQCGLPKVNESFVRVEMTSAEVTEYERILRGYKRKRDTLFLEDQLDDRLVASGAKRMAHLRQILLGTISSPSTKVMKLAHEVMVAYNAGGRVLVFSNFVTHGVDVISHVLNGISVPHSKFSGSTSQKDRETYVTAFLEGKLPVLVLSPVGFEGLDLRGATHVLIADPHFNPERTDQIVARATRAESSDIRVTVLHFLAESPELPKGTIDEVIIRIAARKRKANHLIAAAIGWQNSDHNQMS